MLSQSQFNRSWDGSNKLITTFSSRTLITINLWLCLSCQSFNIPSPCMFISQSYPDPSVRENTYYLTQLSASYYGTSLAWSGLSTKYTLMKDDFSNDFIYFIFLHHACYCEHSLLAGFQRTKTHSTL